MPSLKITLILAALTAPRAWAYETDQFSLPPVPLADTGPEFSALVDASLNDAAASANALIELHENCLALAFKYWPPFCHLVAPTADRPLGDESRSRKLHEEELRT